MFLPSLNGNEPVKTEAVRRFVTELAAWARQRAHMRGEKSGNEQTVEQLMAVSGMCDVGKHIRIEQLEGCLVVLQDVVVTIHHQDSRIHRIQNLLVIFLPLHLFLSRMLQEEFDAVEGLMQNLIFLKPLLRRKIEGEIPIIYRIKKEGYLLDVPAIVAVEANVTHYSHEQKHDNNHLINIHTSKTIEFFTLHFSFFT